MFVTISDFVGKYQLPQDYNQEKLNEIITKQEKKLLVDLLGYSEYTNFLANITEQIWIDFKDGKDYTNTTTNQLVNYLGIKPFLIGFIYFHYIADIDYRTSGYGQDNTENARQFTTNEKKLELYKRYNEAVDYYHDALKFLLNDIATYPNVTSKFKGAIHLINY